MKRSAALDKLFQAPSPTERPLRILVYGLPKTGKSHFVFTATKVGPLFWQDTEGGSVYYDPKQDYGFRVLLNRDPTKAIEAVELASDMVNGERPIAALDSFSSTWFGQQEVAEELTARWSRGKAKDRASFRAWGPAKKPLKKYYAVMMATRCHVIITARAKKLYEVSKSGEPTETGIGPNIERNLAYAVDLIVEMDVAKTKKGVPPKPEDFYALVVGSRSSDIPIGTMFHNPKFSDFLPAAREGKAPEEIGSSVKDQIKDALEPQSWETLKAKLAAIGWDVDQARNKLKEKFGSFNTAMLEEYWEYLKDLAPETSAAKDV